jgi:hypothetical protein
LRFIGAALAVEAAIAKRLAAAKILNLLSMFTPITVLRTTVEKVGL